MSKNTDESNPAFDELIRILEEAVRAGATSTEFEYEGRDLMVYSFAGSTGLGAPRIPKKLERPVIQELVKRAGLSRKSNGTMRVRLLGHDCNVAVSEYDSFGESVFKLEVRQGTQRGTGKPRNKSQ